MTREFAYKAPAVDIAAMVRENDAKIQAVCGIPDAIIGASVAALANSMLQTKWVIGAEVLRRYAKGARWPKRFYLRSSPHGQ